ncbi:hypothetical protein GCM10010411_57700 [Actinomadura fulvescens]|uniref:Uncharacterized protein n=1 Tax=Actinomadura fulvescens TaxID=46160 RepID=A0ABN3Q798_9ACTN
MRKAPAERRAPVPFRLLTACPVAPYGQNTIVWFEAGGLTKTGSGQLQAADEGSTYGAFGGSI